MSEVPMPTEDNVFRDVNYISKITGFKANTIRIWLREGRLKGYMVAGEWRVAEVDLKNFLQEEYK